MRDGGYAQIADYAAIGDGRTAALVARDGSIDWLCLPDFDSPSVFAAILDPDRGGAFRLSPVGPFEAERRYVEGTNVLETTFRTASGALRVRDAMTLIPPGRLAPMREVVRKVVCLDGACEVEWAVEPRFGYGQDDGRVAVRDGRVAFTHSKIRLTLSVWGAEAASSGRTRLAAGESLLFSLASAHHQPAILPGRRDTEERLEHTIRFWREWSARATYDGPWRESVIRSALALKQLCFAPSGAIVAAPSSSLPEQIGGSRNWDYRFSWLRDASYTLDALLNLGYLDEAHAFFWWFMHASRRTQPRMAALYGIDGGEGASERELDLTGYKGSRPVRVGNAARTQLQLDVYGSVFNSIWLHAQSHGELSAQTGRSTARIADHVAECWDRPDSGIWEVRSEPKHHVHSKAMCWAALDRACRLAGAGMLPNRAQRWRSAADAVRDWVETHGWDDELGAYVRAPGAAEVDASILTLPLVDYRGSEERMLSTVNAVRSRLAAGPLLYRYLGEDGVPGDEGAFTTCSFWLVDALARLGRVDEAAALMDELVPLANDVGLFAEELDPSTGEHLGNFPQGLVHLALINAAFSIQHAGAGA
jgi:GH15 family glucan-1,4-alpha-glucosidase